MITSAPRPRPLRSLPVALAAVVIASGCPAPPEPAAPPACAPIDEVCNGVDDDCDGLVDENVLTAGHADRDRDGFGDPDARVEVCALGDGAVADADDCDDADAGIHPGAVERCDGRDDDCDGRTDEELPEHTSRADIDGDGFGDPAATHTGCDTPAGWVVADEGDPADCDDRDPAVRPDAVEVCDGVDQDCDGDVDEDLLVGRHPDADGDGWGNPAAIVHVCPGALGVADRGGDCDDADAAANPDGVEVCDGTDDDCDGLVDELVASLYYLDADGDGFGDPGHALAGCAAPPGYVTDAADCDDREPLSFPGNVEACNAIDDDCDHEVDEGLAATWYADADGDGLGNPWTGVTTCAPPVGFVANPDDCVDDDAAIPPSCPPTLFGDWPTFGQGPARDSHAVGTVGDGVLTFAWSDVAPSGLTPVAVAHGRVFGITGYAFGAHDLVAYDLYDGDLAMELPLAASYGDSGPTVVDGRVCFTSCDNFADSYVVCVDEDDGSSVWSAPIAMQWEVYLPPLAVDGRLYSGGGQYGGLYGHALDDGDELFFAALPQTSAWGASAWDGLVYTYVSEILVAHRPLSGVEEWSIDTGPLTYGYTTLPVIGAGGIAVLAHATLSAVDLSSRSLLWDVNVLAPSAAATRGDSVWVIDGGGTLRRYELATGRGMGSYAGTTGLLGTPVVTDDAVIASSDTTTWVFAHDGTLLQRIPAGGTPVVADNHLILSRATGEVEVWAW